MVVGVGTGVSHEPEYDDFHRLHHAGERDTSLGDQYKNQKGLDVD